MTTEKCKTKQKALGWRRHCPFGWAHPSYINIIVMLLMQPRSEATVALRYGVIDGLYQVQ